MKKASVLDLYAQYHRDRGDERRGLFQIAREDFGVQRGLYPGCFVHVTPSFFLPHMVFIDSDRRSKPFFAAAGLTSLDPDYELVAVVTRRGERFSLSRSDLHEYFVPKSSKLPEEPSVLKRHLIDLGRGVAYRKSAFVYVFRKQ